MFWMENPGNSSAIGALLDSQNVTLADLLNQDDILHECKTQNKKLIEFLERPSTIEELIHLIVSEPTNTDDPANSYRHSTLACEIIASGMLGLIENLSDNPELLKKLYSFLDSKPPLNPLLASFFAKTIQVLLSRHCGQDWYSFQVICYRVLEFFKTTDFLPKLLDHLGTSAILDTLECITRVEGEQMKKDLLEWLDSQFLIEQLISIICGKHKTYQNVGVNPSEVSENAPSEVSLKPVDIVDSTGDSDLPKDKPKPAEETAVPEVKEAEIKIVDAVSAPKKELTPLENRLLMGQSANAAQLICSIIVNGRDPNGESSISIVDPLLEKCKLASTADLLLSSMFSCPLETRQIALINGVQVLLMLLNDVPGPIKAPSVDQVEINQIAEIILPYLPKFKEEILETPPKYKYGYSNAIEKPVGVGRLTVVRLIEVLVHLDNPAVALAIVQNDIVPVLFDMFVEYKWNSFLHVFVESIVTKMSTAPMQKAIYGKHLFIDCQLMDKVVAAWEENDVSQKVRKPRHGYMGHLINIANSLQEYIKQYPEIIEDVSIETKDRWNEMVSDKLDKVNVVQKLFLGGCHPSLAINSAQHQQHPIQLYATEANENYYIADEYDNEPAYNEESNNAEQLFISMCESITSSPMDRQEMMNDNVMNFLMRDLSNSLDKELCDTEYEEDSTPNKSIDQKILGLASKLSGCEAAQNHSFDKWLPSDSRTDWDSEDVDITPTDVLSSMTVNSSSPWGTGNSLNDDQVGWADFSKLENAFNCDQYATFSDLTFAQGIANQNDLFGNQPISNVMNFNNPLMMNERLIGDGEVSFANAQSSESSATSSEPTITQLCTVPAEDIRIVEAAISATSEAVPVLNSNVTDLSAELEKISLNAGQEKTSDGVSVVSSSDIKSMTAHNETEVCDQIETVVNK
ncbi:phosphatase 6 regulatory subunit 1-like protein fmt isoform X2 [Arctopsyche grandis]|uniref:phosphatase 6 regulatory subunit 1-like protein fmt isoform X2 n=1 Tax=Arctopsyche grandis TaxID=121162 RepID=UPI00406D6A80